MTVIEQTYEFHRNTCKKTYEKHKQILQESYRNPTGTNGKSQKTVRHTFTKTYENHRKTYEDHREH